MNEKVDYYIDYKAEQTIITSLNLLADRIYQDNVAKGFYDMDFNCPMCKQPSITERNLGETLMLVVTELAEALEGIRKGYGHKPDEHVPQCKNFEIEIADAIIRLLDLSGYCKIDIGKALVEKLKYNRTREYKHGKKF